MCKNKCNQMICLALVILFYGCSGAEKKKINNHAENIHLEGHTQDLENLTVYTSSNKFIDTVIFERKRIFTDNEEVFIDGYIGNVAVDVQNRVFIAAEKMGKASIYVFHPDGSFITTIGHYGKGPGEFLSISGMEIRDDILMVYDSSQQRISTFSLDNFTLSDNVVLSGDKVENDTALAPLSPGSDFFVLDEDHFLVNFLIKMVSNQFRKMLYYKISKEGSVLPGKILEMQRFRFYMPNLQFTSNGTILIPFTMPFTRSNLIAVSNTGAIFTAWTDHFLIKVYDKNGHYKRGFYYQYKNSQLNLSNLQISEGQRKTLANAKVPETWPAIHTMFFDDQNRLWVLTIINSDSTYEGWVLNSEGKLLAKYRWPGRRANRVVEVEPIFLIKNGYLYTRERNLPKGIDRIVKWKIHFKPNAGN